ncbi:PAS domain S-box protein [Clostridium chromiireducens]|uniref:PAS domain S-box protein n=2 Tax=Clostridium chromiireducens TaxID=225345 RepID=A0A399ISA1_9CLOT|nr:PAS domain S-box protein [Clostridium chromiireducens]RII35923.1 PAS domain S-box protein [Clostridium chromiireducens]
MGEGVLMLHDLFINVTILISFLLIIGQIFKNNSFDHRQALKVQFLLGIAFGLLGIILMMFTIRITDNIIIDLRNISIICAGILGGPISAVFATILIAFFRLIYFGINTASIIAHFVALIIGLGTAYIATMKLSRRNKFIFMFLFSMLISSTALRYLIENKNGLEETVFFYWAVYILGIVLGYYTTKYIISANSNYKNMLYYRMMADNLSDTILTYKAGGKIIFVSPQVEQLSGYTQEELVGTSFYKYIYHEDIESLKKAFLNNVKTKDISTQVFRIKCKDDKYVWVELSMKVMRSNDNSIEQIICVIRDISARKEIENELRISNARFKAIFDNAGLGIVVRDNNEKIIEANTAYFHMLGYSKDEINHLSGINRFKGDEEIVDIFNKLYNDECTLCKSENCYIGKNNERICAEVTSTLIPGTEHDPIFMINIINDITERKRMEKKLKESEERFRVAFDSAVIGMCLAHINGKFFRANQALCDLLGYSQDELLNINFEQITHYDDKEKEIALVEKLLSGEIPHFILEKRYIHKNGKIIWAILGISIVYDAGNKPLYLVGQIQDITLRKFAEHELLKAKDKAEKLATVDFLTGTLNRRAFEERFNVEFSRAEREKLNMSIILADIDFFKKVNDTYGHQVGDIALQKFAQCIVNMCRPYDFVGRHGGEEFVICLPEVTSEQAIMIAERMRKAVENLHINFQNNQEKINITASFGVSSYKKVNGENINNLILRADRAMYKAKNKGRNRVCTEEDD